MEKDDIKNLEKSVFNTLYEIDTRERAVEKDTGKTKLNYLPWATTYSEVCKHFGDVRYEFLRNTIEVEEVTTKQIDEVTTVTTTTKYCKELPYFDTPAGLEVRTAVTIGDIRKEMCLPVYNTSYKSMCLEPYSYTTKYGDKTVDGAKMDDIYKSIMRCFAKNLSMWGVGLNFWTKEDATESVLQMTKAQQECWDLISKRSALSENTKKEVAKICKDMLPDENGDPRLCEDTETLEKLEKKLKTLRKIPD